MEAENESKQQENGQTSKTELPKKTSWLEKLAIVRLAKRKAQEVKKGEEVESPKVETEQKSILYQVTDLKVNKKQVN
ncbi:MAG: hypothetical protein Q7J06_05010 [Bacteroidales bacterium]|nr:hypothetical protein [Bacteroidales bacterium]